MKSRTFVACTAVLGGLSYLAGCDSKTPFDYATNTAELESFLTSSATAMLGSDGTFDVSASASGIISEERAVDLAAALIRTYGGDLASEWTDQRGATVDPAALRLTGSPLFAASPYAPFPDGYHPGFEKGYGPYYLIPFGAGSIDEVVVAVSAYAHDVVITDQGWVDFPKHHGNEFVVEAIPVDNTKYQLRTAEQAAIVAATATGALVADVPTLVLLGRPYSPLDAAWRITLDRPLAASSVTNAELSGTDIYVSQNGELGILMPTPQQPKAHVVAALQDNQLREPRSGAMIELPARPGFELALTPVSHFLLGSD